MKRIIYVGILLISAVFLTGCLEQTKLTEEETDIIAQAAAGQLLKYDKNYTEKLFTPTPTPEPTATPTPTVTPTPTQAPEGTEGQGSGSSSGGNLVANSELTDIIGLTGIALEYSGYEMHDSYTFGSFSVEPQRDGNQLMIVFINVTNNAETSARVNLLELQLEYRLDINNGTYLTPKQSILLNDFQFLDTEIGAGETANSVLVFEVKEDLSPETMNLFIMKDDKTVIIKLK